MQFTRIVKFGDGYGLKDGDPLVVWVQQRLTLHGFTTDVDGQFGTRTRAAVIAFQRAKGLLDDGIVGKNTWAALSTGKTSPTVNVTKPTPAPVPAPTTDYRPAPSPSPATNPKSAGSGMNIGPLLALGALAWWMA